MGNTRSSNRRSVHAWSAQDEPCAWLGYQEPFLDASNKAETTITRRSAQTSKLTNMTTDEVAALPEIDLPATIHQLNSFFAVLWPVCLTMLLTSFAACNVVDEGMTAAMTTYMYYQETPSSSMAEKAVLAFCNALFVIGSIACLTFAIVLLYKFDCMRFFLGYCIFYSATLLGMAGSKIAVLVMGNLHWTVDAISLVFVMYNFAIVGVLSIFYQHGFPTAFEQGYLVCISVIVAWQLAQLPEWSSWMLLLLLGFWDLFAVLTPLGPLRWLVQLVQEKGTPLPGLLFQADIAAAHTDNTSTETTREGDDTFLSSLVADLQPPNAVASGANPVVPVEIERFAHQIAEFLTDQRSTDVARSTELSERFVYRQHELWCRLYAYYGTAFVSPAKSYPIVFTTPPAPSPVNSEADNSIKLGLGDFIFYSVLVARAARHDFAAFSACFLCVLLGLAITMHLLARYDALPALPISIFAGILAFLLVILLVNPFLHQLTAFGIFAL